MSLVCIFKVSFYCPYVLPSLLSILCIKALYQEYSVFPQIISPKLKLLIFAVVLSESLKNSLFSCIGIRSIF